MKRIIAIAAAVALVAAYGCSKGEESAPKSDAKSGSMGSTEPAPAGAGSTAPAEGKM